MMVVINVSTHAKRNVNTVSQVFVKNVLKDGR